MRNTNHSTKTSQFTKTSHSTLFRTLVKNRINKQTIDQILPKSKYLQVGNNQQRNQGCLTKSNVKPVKSETTNMKIYVRNMKQNKNMYNNVDKGNQPKLKKQQTRQTHQTLQGRQRSTSQRSRSSIKSSLSKVSTLMSFKAEQKHKKSLTTKIPYQRVQIPLQQQSRIDKLIKMQQKVEYLIRNKLKNLMVRTKQCNRRMIDRVVQSQLQDNCQFLIDQEVQDILLYIKDLKQKEKDKQNQQEQSYDVQIDISELARKIQLIQKIIASSSTQAQILKKFYFSTKSQRISHFGYKSKVPNQACQHPLILKSQMTSQKPLFFKQSHTNQTYKSPQKQFYIKQKVKYNSFVANRQPFIRSQYSTQFLNYGTVATVGFKPKNLSVEKGKIDQMVTSYMHSFKNRQLNMKQIDYRDLDCVKDKIKSTNISFAQMLKLNAQKKKKIQATNKKDKRESNRLKFIPQQNPILPNPCVEISSSSNTIKTQTQLKFPTSQMKSSFINYQNQRKIQTNEMGNRKFSAVPKQTNLNKLKSCYKALYLR